MSACLVEICETKSKMSEIGKLRQQDNSGDTISAGAIIHELDLVNKLLARAEKAEAALESAQKMCEHWEVKAAAWKARAEKAETARSNRSVLLGQIESILNAANVVKYHPVNEIGECKLMTLAERVESLLESWNNWEQVSFKNLARAEKAEAELSRFMNMPSCSPELFLRSAQRTEKPAPVDWERVRIDAAIATMHGMWACPDTNFRRPMEVIAVECADALVAELQKKEVQG